LCAVARAYTNAADKQQLPGGAGWCNSREGGGGGGGGSSSQQPQCRRRHGGRVKKWRCTSSARHCAPVPNFKNVSDSSQKVFHRMSFCPSGLKSWCLESSEVFKVISSCNASLYSIQTHCFAPQAVCTHHLYNAARGALEALLWWRLRAKLSHKITLLLVSNYWYFPVSVVTVEQLEQEDPERREKSSLATHAMVAILGMYIHLCACDTCGGVSYIRVGGLVWETVCVHEDVFDTRFLTCAVSSARKRSLPPTSSHSTASFDHRAERAGEGIAQLKGNS
jgi:hypothetical protein